MGRKAMASPNGPMRRRKLPKTARTTRPAGARVDGLPTAAAIGRGRLISSPLCPRPRRALTRLCRLNCAGRRSLPRRRPRRPWRPMQRCVFLSSSSSWRGSGGPSPREWRVGCARLCTAPLRTAWYLHQPCSAQEAKRPRKQVCSEVPGGSLRLCTCQTCAVSRPPAHAGSARQCLGGTLQGHRRTSSVSPQRPYASPPA